jgi:hypothetical protein
VYVPIHRLSASRAAESITVTPVHHRPRRHADRHLVPPHSVSLILPTPQPLDPLLAECRHVDERPFVLDQSEQLQSFYIGRVMGARAGVAIGDPKQCTSFVGTKLNK